MEVWISVESRSSESRSGRGVGASGACKLQQPAVVGVRQENRRFRGLARTECDLLMSVFFLSFHHCQPRDIEEVRRRSDDGVLITLGVALGVLVMVSMALDIEFRNKCLMTLPDPQRNDVKAI